MAVSLRYRELLLSYEDLRLAHTTRRMTLLQEVTDPFLHALPCWKHGGSEDAETLVDLVTRVSSYIGQA